MDFDFNENHSAANNNSNDSSLLIGNVENGHLTVKSPLTHSTPVMDQDMTGVDCNIQLETSSGSFIKDVILSNNGEENDSFSKTVNSSLESAVKNIKCSPLKPEIADINHINTSKCSYNISNELSDADSQNCVNNSITEDSKNSENILCPTAMDIVDFSFKDSGNVVPEVQMLDSLSNYNGNVMNPTADFNLVKDVAVHLTSKEQKSLTANIAGEDIESKSASEILQSVNATGNSIDPTVALISSNNSSNNVPVDSCKVGSDNKMFENSVKSPVGDFSNIDSVLKVPENPMNDTVKKFSNIHLVSEVSENSTDKPFENFANVHSISKVSVTPVNKPAGDFSAVDTLPENPIYDSPGGFSTGNPISQVPGNPINKPTVDFSIVNTPSHVPENSVDKPAGDFSINTPSHVPENSVDKPAGDFSSVDSPSQVPENPINEPAGDFSIVDTSPHVPENLRRFSIVDTSPHMPENSVDKPAGDFFIVDTESQVPENLINKSTGNLSITDTLSQMLEKPIHKPTEDSSNAGIEFKVPENTMNEQLEFSNAGHSSYKNRENIVYNTPTCSFNVDSVNKDSTVNTAEKLTNEDLMFKMSEDQYSNPSDKFLDVDFGFKIPENPITNECDEEFTDAVQFFKDPNSFQFLENIKTSAQPESTIPRSSLYVKFDPLMSKISPNVPKPDNTLISNAAKETQEVSSEKISPVPEVINKHLVDVGVRESTGNILISFDSPRKSTSKDTKTSVILSPPKLYTEDELQQKLKIHELTTQEIYLKKQREMESQLIKRDNLIKIQKVVLEEYLSVTSDKFDEFKKALAKIELFETENKKLKDDLKTSAEDLQSVENTFADFHKRYEQCKGMLKTYKENEEHLKQVISDLQNKLKEQEQMYSMLQERTEEMLDKANSEVSTAKRAGESQIAVLNAQLKKAEMKITSLESDIKQIKIENSQLGGICDDLMAKVSMS
ncbi:transforming acidic coiled-coil-containing protein 3 [Trichonephila inaurata madagascariensis]|uniref:Transforming acidic coiled-coil-containing protein 3 n=1 Tax=Trichonephila inaurata madagascariensis TaxID=2747483 RepID=A0A8X7CKT2_9ARAC|nr:transforming acidic coiled-coil-containing protein 3 [Trichonephila inaurata madagascariensis]